MLNQSIYSTHTTTLSPTLTVGYPLPWTVSTKKLDSLCSGRSRSS